MFNGCQIDCGMEKISLKSLQAKGLRIAYGSSISQAVATVNATGNIPFNKSTVGTFTVIMGSLVNDKQVVNSELKLTGNLQSYKGNFKSQINIGKSGWIKGVADIRGSISILKISNWQTTTHNSTAKISAEISLDWQQRLQWHLDIAAEDLNINSHLLNFKLASQQSLNQQSTQLQFDYASYKLILETTGNWQDKNKIWLNRINELTIKTAYGNWQTGNGGTWSYGNDKVSWQQLCLSNKGSKLCSKGFFAPNSWQVSAYSDSIDLHNLPRVATSLTQSGKVNFNIDLQKKAKQSIAGKLTINLLDYAVASSSSSVGSSTVIVPSAKLNIIMQRKTWQANFLAQLVGKDKLAAKLDLNANKTIDGTLSTNLNDLHEYTTLFPDLYRLNGKIAGTLNVAGTIAKPKYQGQIKLTNFSAVIPSIGLLLTNTKASIIGNDDKLNFVASASSAQGDLKLNSLMSFSNLQPNISAKISGKDFLLMDIKAIRLYVSPDLSFKLLNWRQELSGTVTIPKANINSDLIHKQEQLSRDIVWINKKGQVVKPEPILPFYSKIKLIAGDDVNFKGYGMAAKVTGNIEINSYPRQSAIGNGQLTLIDASYKQYGKKFNISNGHIIFNHSPIDNPALSMTASYNIAGSGSSATNEITVGVKISGTIENPKFSLFSNPAMSEENILSYMVLGVPANSLQGEDKNTLSNAALLFALNGGDQSILNSLQRNLDLDQISFGNISTTSDNQIQNNPNSYVMTDSGTNNDAAVFIGKTIAPGLYVSYGVGLFNQQQEIKASYKLSKYFEILTQHNSQYSGVDLVFNVNV